MNRVGQIWLLLILGIIIFSNSACNTTKYLKKEGIYLVEKNVVEIVSDEKIKDKGSLQYNLSTQYKQKPNGKFLGMFRARLWFHHRNQSESDTTKWDNWVRRFIAESPVVHQEKLTEATAESMKSYLQHKGYFNAEVEYEVWKDSIRNLAYNTYTVYTNRQYYYDTIQFVAEDDYIQKILNDTREESYLKEGESVDVSNYDREVNRIVRQMRNLGYLDFTKNFVSTLDADTLNYKVNATLRVLSPQDSLGHYTYRIGDVEVYPNYDPEYRDIYREEEVLKGVSYMSVGRPNIKFTTLARNIKLRAGDLYRLSNEETTRKRLASLGIYKFISVKAVKRTDESGIVDFRIYLPLKNKQEVGADIELNTANNATINNTSIGTAVNLSYRNKNLFMGAEELSVGLQGGLEFAISDPNRVFNSVDVTATTSLNIPKFVDYAGFYTLLNKMRLLPDRAYNNLKETANTRVKLEYNYLELVNFYKYNSLEGSIGYNISPTSKWRIRYTQTGLTYFNPTTELAFDEILNDNPFLARSFGRQLFTGLLARDVQATYIGNPKKKDLAWTAQLSGEISGMEILSLNRIFSPNNEWQLFDTIQYSSYLKFDFEQTIVKTFSPARSVAFRVNSGFAFPYGRFSDAVPYVKQFFVGGPNSIRAWNIRELGPGGYFDEAANDSSTRTPFYQTGDIKMEMNLEYRFDMFWLVEGAVFLDVGNVWTLREDVDRPGSSISTDFWRQFAVGTGMGFRMDFSYFIMRFDLGYPIRNNFKNENNSYWKYSSFRALRMDDINFNLAIGYPFG